MNHVDARESAASLILFNVFLFVVFVFCAHVHVRTSDSGTGDGGDRNDGVYEHRLKYSRGATDPTDDATRCNGASGLPLGPVKGHDGPPDCDRICGHAGGKYKTVETDGSTLVDGVEPADRSYYCVRDGVSVIKCNPATSDVLRGYDGSWTCRPRWPNVFGGPDGNDVLVCGGLLDDDGVPYRGRIGVATRMKPVTDPYDDMNSDGTDYRFKCTAGRYTGGPTDHMSNAYVQAPFNRFYRTRNGCAKYVVNASDKLTFDGDRPGHCLCLKDVHGPLRKRHDTKWSNGRSGGNALVDGRESVPHACSPCVNTVDLRWAGIVNAPRACVKSNQRYVDAYTGLFASVDTLPCGVKAFTDESAACVDSTVRIGYGTISSEAKVLVRALDGPQLSTYEERQARGFV